MINGIVDNSPVRQVKAKVELYLGSTLIDTYTYRDKLISFKIERIGEDSKFFGFGMIQKLNVHLIDKDRNLNITTSNSFKVYLSTGEEYINSFPQFFITEIHRDENTNELSITAYDILYWTPNYSISQLNLQSYTIDDISDGMTQFMGTGLKYINCEDTFTLYYEHGGTFEGTENFKEVLDDIAEVTQSIYFVNAANELVFKRLDFTAPTDLIISKADYITLDSKTNRRLATITKATQLGDDVYSTIGESGTTQYVIDNAFWEKREDIQTLLDDAIAAIGGLTINQFDCFWRGNYLLEPGDKIELVTKDNEKVTSYILNDSIEYNGFLSQKTSWKYEENLTTTPANASTLGEALKQTYARVDKANKRIDMVVSDNTENRINISQITATTEGLKGKVESVEKTTQEALGNVNNEISTLTKSVEAKMTDQQVEFKINQALSNGVDKVETTTGFTFNDTGLTVSKTDTEMKTTITENGMTVFKNNQAVLTANKDGVDAKNLHATTYLIIGNNSRFEDYGYNRTGCFWIGG